MKKIFLANFILLLIFFTSLAYSGETNLPQMSSKVFEKNIYPLKLTLDVFSVSYNCDKKPQILKLSKAKGNPGITITITGKNFCDSQGQVLFGKATATVSTWSDTSIAVQVPNIKVGKSGKNVNVKVKSSNGKSSNAKTFKVLK